ncbi:acyltransferase family protein [Pseudahrensia aquimaris]|uniref:Acyltransferase family protein n=1 Tax=Pseudahrensia aquimaris TaxID=744461 RepID=A0ABW3FIK9_9HYPH
MSSTVAVKYRPEIDGMRAIAVVAVVLYHADLTFSQGRLFSGGFLGVDIFFVISGYLISMILLKETAENRFSFLRFYERRARRILPALFAVMLFTIVPAWFLLIPESMKEFAGSGMSALLFGSNFWFRYEDSYIAEASALKPLLHTWSLSVEEQYYILAPISLLIVRRFFNDWLMPLMIVGFWGSLGLAIGIVRSEPEFAFFLLPTRAWEILAGAILAKLELDWRDGKTGNALQQFLGGRSGNGWLTGLGLVMILGPMVLMNEEMAHPSYLTIIPVLGTVLVIRFARENVWSAQLLSNRPMVAVGLISYSLYLWHWPILVYARIAYDEIGLAQKIICIAFAVALSIASYFMIERPFRGTRFGRRFFTAASLGVFAVLMFLFSNFYATSGALYRLDAKARDYYRAANFTHWHTLKDGKNLGKSLQNSRESARCYMRDPRTACQFGNGKWITVGDSYAGSYNIALRELMKPRGDGITDFSYSRCSFVSEIWFSNTICVIVNRLRWEVIREMKQPRVFVITMNDDYLTRGKEATADPRADFKRKLRRGKKVPIVDVVASYHNNVRELLKLGHRVVLIKAMPKPRESVRDVYFRELIRRSAGSALGKLDYLFNKNPEEYARLKKIDALLTMEDHPNLIQVSPSEIFCPEKFNRRCINVNPDGPIYSQAGHPSVLGAKIVLQKVLEEYDRRFSQ